MFELAKQFSFEAAHTLRRNVDAAPSRRIHGHSYRAEVTVQGERDDHGMVLDLGVFGRAIEDARAGLDHHFLDEVPDLGPATIENLSAWIWRAVAPACPGLVRVAVWRESSGDRCTYFGPES
jgi:6-pyruvoyltetrahydropterin/6-carboxytetrahydropterin synthase